MTKGVTTGNSIIKFIKSSGIFLIGTVLSKAIVFFMLPIYTKFIKPADYGYYDLSSTYISLLTSVLFFDVWCSIMRFMYDSREDCEKYKVVYSGWVIFGFSTLAYTAIGITVALTMNIRYIGWVFLFGIFSNLSDMYGFTVRGFEKNKVFAISGVFSTLVNVATNIFMIVFLHWDYSALYISFILGNSVQIIYLECKIRLLKNYSHKHVDFSVIKPMFLYTLPLCISSAAYWLFFGFDRLVINRIMGTAENGYFAIGDKFSSMIALVTMCFTFAWQELSFKHAAGETVGEKKSGDFYSRGCNVYLKFLGAGAATLIPACNVLFPFLVNKGYASAKTTIPLFLLVSLINALSAFISNVFYAIKATKVVFISMIFACVLNLLLCVPLIHVLGMNGANLSIFLSFLLNIIIQSVILHKNIRFQINLRSALSMLAWIGFSMIIYRYTSFLVNLIWLITCIIITLLWFRNYIKMIVERTVA